MAEKNDYELTYIINAALGDDQIKDIIARVNKFLEESEAEAIELDEWGNQRLSYPINKKRNGYYVNMYFRCDGEVIVKLERALEINDSVLRYLTLRMDAK
ncbi:MAG: 30S ribosomal protein S6, partial [Acidimicrobiia bacterium]|nr:30S ribosomal protein S6 [Acidimicrobiia bacterium]